MNNGTYEVCATVRGMKIYHLHVANRKRKLGSMPQGFSCQGPSMFAPFRGQHPVHQDTVDPISPPEGIIVRGPAPDSVRVEDHEVRPEPLLDEAPVLEAEERSG